MRGKSKTSISKLTLLAGGFLLLSLYSSALWAAPESEAKLKIGAILPLSGPIAAFGRNSRQGLEMALAELPTELRQKIEVLYEDDAFEALKSVSAYRRLKMKGIQAVLLIGSSPAHAVVPLAERDKIISIAVGASDPEILKNRKFAFIHWVRPLDEAVLLVAEIKRRGYQRIGIITAEQQGAIAVYEAFLQQLKELGLGDKILLDQRYLPDARDFRDYVALAARQQLDVVITTLFPGSLAIFARQLRSALPNAHLVGAELFEDEDEVKASQGALMGQWYVNADRPTPDFFAAYQRRFNEAPAWGSGNTYDVLHLLARAYQEVGLDPDKLNNALERVENYQGAMGTYSATADRWFAVPAALMVVTPDGFKRLEPGD